MKPFAIILLAASFLISAELKTGYYYSLQDFINNTPTSAQKSSRVVEGNGEFGSDCTAYFVEELEDMDFKRVHAKQFEGYCDSGKVYLVDNANLFKGRIMRSVTVGTRFSYFHGIDFQMSGGGGFMPGTSVSTPAGMVRMGGTFIPGSGMPRTSTPKSVLVVIDMKTGEQTSISDGLFSKAKTRQLLADYPDLLQEYKKSKSSGINMAVLYIDKINAMPN